MAELAVSLAIDKLLPILSQELKLLKGVHEEIADIRDDLEAIRGFLKDANSKAEQEGISEGVKVWIKQAREVAYCIEDAIDKYMLHVAQHHDRNGFAGFLHKTSQFITKLQPRHEIASEIQDIRKTLQKIRNRIEGFQFISLQQGASSSNARNVILHDPRSYSLFIEEAELVGIESSRNELISLLVSGESRRTVISVVGMGGVGKTTLLKKVYDNHRVKEQFQCHAWITVSQSYNKKELLKTMLAQFYKAKSEAFPDRILTMDDLSLIEELRQYLQLQRYLVVFDDVWEIGFWGDVESALLDNDNGSRILATTRNSNVASFCKRFSLVHIHQLEPLAEKEAWELFCKKAFKFEFEGICPKELEESSREIVQRCGGLPLAIVVIGGLLATKEKVIPEWQKLLHSLRFEMVSHPYVENITKILSLSFSDLPYNLKSCFLYLGMLPEDFSIKRKRLIQLWVAMGFVQEKPGSTLEEVGAEYLTELIHRSLVQVDEVSAAGIPKTSRVHDLVRDVILIKSEELSLCHVSRDRSTFEGIARHLSISKSRSDNPKSCIKSQTRSIMLFNGVELQKPLLKAIFGNCKLLTALDFERSPVAFIPKELGNLVHLKYFNLRYTKVSKLPRSIGKLHKLECIDLRHSLVKEIPVEINNFPKLQHLSADDLKISGNIGYLQFLQKLTVVRVDDDVEEGFIEQLGMLKQLKKLGINCSRRYGKDLWTVLEKMIHLQLLLVRLKDMTEHLEVRPICPPPHFQTLYLWGALERLDWISELHNLVKLHLNFSRLKDDPIKAIEALPKLTSLVLVSAYNEEKIHFEEGGFRKLKQLMIVDHEFNTIIIDKGAMPLLEKLRIGPCPQLKEVPSGIQHLKNLKKLSFGGMSDEFNQRLSREQGEDYLIVKHVPILQYDGIYKPDDDTSYGAFVERHFGWIINKASSSSK